MLLLADGTVVYSPTDLTAAATCEFALVRGLDATLGRIAPFELAQDALLERLAELGDRHERQVLAGLRRRYGPPDAVTGRGVVEIARPARADSRNPAALAAARDATLAALRGGADVVFQAGFFDGRFTGWADFVVRSDDGATYSVHDAKLAHRARTTALLQLAAYADQLLTAGIPMSDHVHLVLGDRTVTDHRLDDLLPVYRVRRARLEQVLDDHVADAGPVTWGDERYRACLRCEVCTAEIEAAPGRPHGRWGAGGPSGAAGRGRDHHHGRAGRVRRRRPGRRAGPARQDQGAGQAPGRPARGG